MRQGEIRRGRQDEDGLDRMKQGKGNTRQSEARKGKAGQKGKTRQTRQDEARKNGKKKSSLRNYLHNNQDKTEGQVMQEYTIKQRTITERCEQSNKT